MNSHLRHAQHHLCGCGCQSRNNVPAASRAKRRARSSTFANPVYAYYVYECNKPISSAVTSSRVVLAYPVRNKSHRVYSSCPGCKLSAGLSPQLGQILGGSSCYTCRQMASLGRCSWQHCQALQGLVQCSLQAASSRTYALQLSRFSCLLTSPVTVYVCIVIAVVL